MSDAEEDYGWFDPPERNFGNKGYWIIRNGYKIKIKDMKISHIKNCIKFLKKQCEDEEGCEEKINEFENELKIKEVKNENNKDK